MEKHTTYFYQPVKNLLWTGVQIYDIENKYLYVLHKIYSVIFLGIFAYGYLATEITYAYENLHDIEQLTLSFGYVIAHSISIVKLILLAIKRKSIGKFITSLEHGEFLPNFERGGAEEKAIIDYAVWRTNIQGKAFGFTVAALVSSSFIQVILNTKQMMDDIEANATMIEPAFPYPSTLPFYVNSYKPVGYFFESLYEAFCVTMFGWYLGNSDTIITGLMIHVTAQFKIVTNSMLTIMDKAERNTNIYPSKILEKSQSLEVYGERAIDPALTEKLNANLLICVNDCIRHHNSILDLLENMENTFNDLVLIQLLGYLMAMCVGLYQTSLTQIPSTSFVSTSSFTLAMTFQLLIYCWNGNELSLYSVKVAEAAYDCRWLTASREVKLSLVMVIQRAQRLSYLTAGKFVNLTLETFMSILRGSISYFMVLRTVNEEEIAE